MIRIAAVLLALASALALGGCATTSTVQQRHATAPGQAYGYAFVDRARTDDVQGVATLVRTIRDRMRDAGLLAMEPVPGARVEVELTHYYLRGDAARFLAGILAGRDRIASRVTVYDADDAPVGRFEVETTNLTAAGTGEGLMERHADEIVARLRP